MGDPSYVCLTSASKLAWIFHCSFSCCLEFCLEPRSISIQESYLILSKSVLKSGIFLEGTVSWGRWLYLRWYTRDVTVAKHWQTHWFVVMEVLKPTVEFFYAILLLWVE